MCEPDLGMLIYVWTRGFKQVSPDFNVYVLPCWIHLYSLTLAMSRIHKCRPHLKVLNWAEEHNVHSLNISGFVRAPGALVQEGRP